MKNKMTAGQLTQIYTIATQQGCDSDKVQALIESGYMADFFAGQWDHVVRSDFRSLGGLIPEPTNQGRTITIGGETKQSLLQKMQHAGMAELTPFLEFPLREEYLESNRQEIELRFFVISHAEIKRLSPHHGFSYEAAAVHFVERYGVECLTSEMILALRLDSINQPLWPGGPDNWYAPQLPGSMQPTDRAIVSTQLLRLNRLFAVNAGYLQGGEVLVFAKRRK
jgi:hypothetical protein